MWRTGWAPIGRSRALLHDLATAGLDAMWTMMASGERQGAPFAAARGKLERNARANLVGRFSSGNPVGEGDLDALGYALGRSERSSRSLYGKHSFVHEVSGPHRRERLERIEARVRTHDFGAHELPYATLSSFE